MRETSGMLCHGAATHGFKCGGVVPLTFSDPLCDFGKEKKGTSE